MSQLPFATAVAARDNYKLLIRDNTYALARLRLEPERRAYLRDQRARWQFVVECIDAHLARITAKATRDNGGPLPF